METVEAVGPTAMVIKMERVIVIAPSEFIIAQWL